MSKNPGKRFEEDIQKSVPEHWFCYRLKDSSGSWSNDKSKSRFTPTNMSDFIVFNTDENLLFGLECKSFLGKSMSYNNLNDKKGNKLDQLCSMSKKKNCWGGFILNFRNINAYTKNSRVVSATYWVEATVLYYLKKHSGRKSISLTEVGANGLRIPQELKRVRYNYKLDGVL